MHSRIGLLGLFQTTADCGSMYTQLVRNLGEPIPVLPIDRMDQPSGPPSTETGRTTTAAAPASADGEYLGSLDWDAVAAK